MLLPFIFKQVTLVPTWLFPVVFLMTSQVVLVLLLEVSIILFQYNFFAVEITLLNIYY
jgi:hypothetical protein